VFYNGPITGNSRDSALVVRGTQLLGSFLIPHTASPPRLCLLHRVPCCSVDVEPPGLDLLIPYVFSKIPKRVRGSYASTLLSSAIFSAPVVHSSSPCTKIGVRTQPNTSKNIKIDSTIQC
jgi:hypothetical protein